MARQRVGIIMNGVTGRMGRVQHLARSIAAMRADGGLEVGGVTIWPDPVLVGRDLERLRSLAAAHDIERVSTDLDACLADPADTVYFDSQTTARREQAVALAIAAGKDVYCEKPSATTSAAGYELADLAERAGVRNGAVQDKLFLPGLLKLREVLDSGALGRLLAIRIEFGYWVFPDAIGATQRPSWNYRAEDGGGIVLDMFCHFRYLLEHLFAPVESVLCEMATHESVRVDEGGRTYDATAEDAAYAIFRLAGGAVAQVNASWCTRPYRDDLFVLHADGTGGSAVAGLQECRIQPGAATPRYVWNPDVAASTTPRAPWLEVPGRRPPVNAFRHQWELFLRHLVTDEPFPWDLRDAARGVEVAELALASARERRWVDVPGSRA